MAIIYMGSLDDRVYHYPWISCGPHVHTQSYLRSYLNSIVQNTLIGHQSAINDGYLVNNPILRETLFLDKKSILRDLLFTGQIVIPGRKPSFSELIQEQREKGITTFDEIPTDVLKEIDKIDDRLKKTKAREKGPESTTIWAGFFDLMATLKDRQFGELGISKASYDDFNLALDTFLDLSATIKHPSRTQWEEVLKDLNKKGKFSGHNTELALMNLGNEAYHYNYADKLAKYTKKRIDVETIHTPAFSNLLDDKKMEIDAMVKDLPLIQIPKFNNLLQRKKIEMLLDESTRIGIVRNDFIEILSAFNQNPNEDNLKKLKARAEVYNALINEEFRCKSDEYSALAVSFVISMTLGKISYLANSAALSWVLGEASGRIITNKFNNGQPNEIDYKKYLLASSKMKGV